MGTNRGEYGAGSLARALQATLAHLTLSPFSSSVGWKQPVDIAFSIYGRIRSVVKTFHIEFTRVHAPLCLQALRPAAGVEKAESVRNSTSAHGPMYSCLAALRHTLLSRNNKSTSTRESDIVHAGSFPAESQQHARFKQNAGIVRKRNLAQGRHGLGRYYLASVAILRALFEHGCR